MNFYDVIIIGAGPAGLSCAENLAKNNIKVLVLEKNKVIGPKICAGGLTGKDIGYLKLPEKLLDYKYKKMIVHSRFNEVNIKLDKYFVYTIDREKLGQWQLKKAKKAGAIIRTKAIVTKIENNSVTVNENEKYTFKYLIGADGSSSLVKRYLGIESNMGIGIQYIIKTKKYKNLEIFFDSKLFSSWYAWIFPHKDYVSIGCGCDPKILSPNKLLDNFKKWLNKNNIDITKGKYESHPINGDYKGYAFKNIFLIGDAAGLASNLTGEGIYQALVSGEEIAKMILDKSYISEKMEQLLKTKRLHNKIEKILAKSGPLRQIEYELGMLLLKNKKFKEKAMSIIT